MPCVVTGVRLPTDLSHFAVGLLAVDRVSDLVGHSQYFSLADGPARVPQHELRARGCVDLRLVSPEPQTNDDAVDSRLDGGAIEGIDCRPYGGLLIRVIQRAKF